jgi:hypothetical protein
VTSPKHFGIENDHSVLEWKKQLSIAGWRLDVDPASSSPLALFGQVPASGPREIHPRNLDRRALSAVRIELYLFVQAKVPFEKLARQTGLSARKLFKTKLRHPSCDAANEMSERNYDVGTETTYACGQSDRGTFTQVAADCRLLRRRGLTEARIDIRVARGDGLPLSRQAQVGPLLACGRHRPIRTRNREILARSRPGNSLGNEILTIARYPLKD